jgi:hypothetical protein
VKRDQPRTFPSLRRLTPEEDAIGDPENDDDIDDTLPADLWFRRISGRTRGRSANKPVY